MSRSSGFGQSKLYQNTLYSILYTVYMCVHYGFFRRACQNLAVSTILQVCDDDDDDDDDDVDR